MAKTLREKYIDSIMRTKYDDDVENRKKNRLFLQSLSMEELDDLLDEDIQEDKDDDEDEDLYDINAGDDIDDDLGVGYGTDIFSFSDEAYFDDDF